MYNWEETAQRMRELFIRDMNDRESVVYRVVFVPYAAKYMGQDAAPESAVDGYIEMMTGLMQGKTDSAITMPVLDALNAARTWSVAFQVPEDELYGIFGDEAGLILHVPFAGFRLTELGEDIITKYFLVPYYRELAWDPAADNEMNRDLDSFVLSVH